MEYFHSFVGATLVAPGPKTVLPPPPEFVRPQDGASKQDCEPMAARRCWAGWARPMPGSSRSTWATTSMPDSRCAPTSRPREAASCWSASPAADHHHRPAAASASLSRHPTKPTNPFPDPNPPTRSHTKNRWFWRCMLVRKRIIWRHAALSVAGAVPVVASQISAISATRGRSRRDTNRLPIGNGERVGKCLDEAGGILWIRAILVGVALGEVGAAGLEAGCEPQVLGDADPEIQGFARVGRQR